MTTAAVVTKTPPKQIGGVLEVSNMATGGTVAIDDANSIEQFRAVLVKQTTADQTIALPAPTDTSVVFGVDVSSTGTEAFTISGVRLQASSSVRLVWDKTAWTAYKATITAISTWVKDTQYKADEWVIDANINVLFQAKADVKSDLPPSQDPDNWLGTDEQQIGMVVGFGHRLTGLGFYLMSSSRLLDRTKFKRLFEKIAPEQAGIALT
jgi:hypothetical protein